VSILFIAQEPRWCKWPFTSWDISSASATAAYRRRSCTRTTTATCPTWSLTRTTLPESGICTVSLDDGAIVIQFQPWITEDSFLLFPVSRSFKILNWVRAKKNKSRLQCSHALDVRFWTTFQNKPLAFRAFKTKKNNIKLQELTIAY